MCVFSTKRKKKVCWKGRSARTWGLYMVTVHSWSLTSADIISTVILGGRAFTELLHRLDHGWDGLTTPPISVGDLYIFRGFCCCPVTVALLSQVAIWKTLACYESWAVVGREGADGCLNGGEEGYNCRLPLMEPLKLDSLHRTAVT